MNRIVSIREFGRIYVGSDDATSLDRAFVSSETFEWLIRQSNSINRNGGALCAVEGTRCVQIKNYVGVIDSPYGERIEVLPKFVSGEQSIQASRSILKRMISHSLELGIEGGASDIDSFNLPLNEWIIQRFLEELGYLLRRGIRRDYISIETREVYLRGRLNIRRQISQPPGSLHFFCQEESVFEFDCPENRIIKSCLLAVARHTRMPMNWRLANELKHRLFELPPSCNVGADLKSWRSDRFSEKYRSIKIWCELILKSKLPLALIGEWQGLSMLFPMEKVFERFVLAILEDSVIRNQRIVYQAKEQYLCHHEDDPIFRLEPDFLLKSSTGENLVVLDAKWKLLDQNDRLNNFKISASDFYQMFSYGHRYLQGSGNLMLLYPQTDKFSAALPFFYMNDTRDLVLSVVPVDLEKGKILFKPDLPLTNEW